MEKPAHGRDQKFALAAHWRFCADHRYELEISLAAKISGQSFRPIGEPLMLMVTLTPSEGSSGRAP
jgi:hypothetical protein